MVFVWKLDFVFVCVSDAWRLGLCWCDQVDWKLIGDSEQIIQLLKWSVEVWVWTSMVCGNSETIWRSCGGKRSLSFVVFKGHKRLWNIEKYDFWTFAPAGWVQLVYRGPFIDFEQFVVTFNYNQPICFCHQSLPSEDKDCTHNPQE